MLGSVVQIICLKIVLSSYLGRCKSFMIPNFVEESDPCNTLAVNGGILEVIQKIESHTSRGNETCGTSWSIELSVIQQRVPTKKEKGKNRDDKQP